MTYFQNIYKIFLFLDAICNNKNQLEMQNFYVKLSPCQSYFCLSRYQLSFLLCLSNFLKIYKNIILINALRALIKDLKMESFEIFETFHY